MYSERFRQATLEADVGADPIGHLRTSIKGGRHWPVALLEAMALWALPQEVYQGRQYAYLIGGEAFDWLLLAERLCDAAFDLIPQQEIEELLFEGRFPEYLDANRFRELLGIDKYRGYLNYFYGVTVEEALQLAVEREVHKRHLSNGNQYQGDFSEEAYLKIYHAPKGELLALFRQERGYPDEDFISLSESKEFTYWLFKYRIRTLDKAKIASDTRKGLEQLREMLDGRQHAAAIA